MDPLTAQLHSFLVNVGMDPAVVSPQMEHYLEHLLYLLPPEDEQAVIRYYGLFGELRLSLQEIALQLGMSQEDTMERIDRCVRKLAVTPEWQMLRQMEKK